MDQKRLEAILEERRVNPTAYQRDGWKYFEEAIPDIQALFVKPTSMKIESKVEIPKAPYIPTPTEKVKKLLRRK